MIHPKGALMERCKALGLPKPRYDTKRSGPEHEPTFIADVLVGGEVYGTGQGGNKRDAERRASEEALAYIERQSESRTKAPAPAPARTPAPASAARPQAKAAPASRATADESFDGPWPLFPALLASCLKIANSRIDEDEHGMEALTKVQDLGLQLYKSSLENLAEVVELEDEDEV